MQTLNQLRIEAKVSRRLWVKVLGMLQQNWCTLEPGPKGATHLIFFDDHGDVFDWMSIPDKKTAQTALRFNGFFWLRESSSFFSASGLPRLPTAGVRKRHRPIYSNGEYWQTPTRDDNLLAPTKQISIPITSSDSDLRRFIDAQDIRRYEIIEELAAGRKTSHWMWFVFPQLRGLGKSTLAHYFGLSDPREAADYWDDDLLGDRLKSNVRLLLNLPSSAKIEKVFGHIDAKKLRSCMTLNVKGPG